MSSLSKSARSLTPALKPRLPEAAFYLVVGVVVLGWSLGLVADFVTKFAGGVHLQTAFLRNSGSSMLILVVSIISAISFFATISALRGRSLQTPTASMLLITICALRTLQILTEGKVTVLDANVLGALFFAASVLYVGSPRVWWIVLMPLATIASFSPLVWLEFYQGVSNQILLRSILVPGSAFVLGSLLIVVRELRLRSLANIVSIRALRARGETTMSSLRNMESDLKSLRAVLSGERAEVGPLETTEFNLGPARVEPSETCSFNEIDSSARGLLAEARAAVEGRPVKLSLTAPSGAGLPIAVRGSANVITAWMRSAILSSIESLGGFPDGMVRVSIRPSLSSLVISIEDNGRGFGESLSAKVGQTEDRISATDIRVGVEKLGGRFDIQSRLGVGSRLSMEIPRIDAFASAPRVAAAARVSALQFAAPSPESMH